MLDGALPKEDIETIEKIINSHTDILGFKNLKTRKSGQHKHANTFISKKDYDRKQLPNSPTFFSMSTPVSGKKKNQKIIKRDMFI